jgi:Trk K+ transport system NAD-binding subunit
VQVYAGSPLDGATLSQADRPLSVRVIGLAAAGSEWVDWAPDPRRLLAAGDRVMIVARRAGLRALVEHATPPAEPTVLDETP